MIFTIFMAGLAATLLMTGLAWQVQLVHYPSFRFIDAGRFSGFHQFHSNRITLIVSPLMLIELVSAIILVFNTDFMPAILSIPALLLILAIVADTGLRVVPVHNRLGSEGPDPALISELSRKNLLRTLMWTLRSALLLSFFYLAI